MENGPEKHCRRIYQSLNAGAFKVDWLGIEHLPERLRERQRDFARTGGLHAAALADPDGNIEAVFEDIGRHNALDKLIGHCFLEGRLPLADRLIFMSSRSSFELVQKALMAGCPMLATVGGPSSLAIEMAREHGLTLLGILPRWSLQCLFRRVAAKLEDV